MPDSADLGDRRNHSGTHKILSMMSLSDFCCCCSKRHMFCFPCLHVELTPKCTDKRRISKQTLPGFEADVKVTWFQQTRLEHEPFVCCWKFSTWISGWAVQFIKENVDTSCQRLFSLVPENGRHCVFGTHTEKANSDSIVPWEQKLLPRDKMGDPRLLLALLHA